MSRLEHQITDIMNAMYDSVTNDDFDSISDYTDRVSGAIDNDSDRNDKDEMPYDNYKDEIPMTMTKMKCPIVMIIKCPTNMTMIIILP